MNTQARTFVLITSANLLGWPGIVCKHRARDKIWHICSSLATREMEHAISIFGFSLQIEPEL